MVSEYLEEPLRTHFFQKNFFEAFETKSTQNLIKFVQK